jgi:lipoyl(octanoyl) transferase
MIIKALGRQPYLPIYQAMQDFTATRTPETEDEIWCVEHDAVFTQGLNGKPEHLLMPSEIPVVQTDRGGQITYHGPGQIVMYFLIDLRRLGMGVRQMVSLMEQALIAFLSTHQQTAYARPEAPGVYIGESKIAALGLRVKRGACYHGLSLNVAMDLSPFAYINPCGYPGMAVTDLASLGVELSLDEAQNQLLTAVKAQLKKGKG